MKKAFFFMLLALLCAGCNRTLDIQGEVFVVTKGGANIKLGRVEVRAIDSFRIKNVINVSPSARVKFSELEYIPAEEKTFSDSDGRFKLQLPAGETYFLVARAGREALGEKYFWCVKVNPIKPGTVSLALSNDNMADVRLEDESFDISDLRIEAGR